MKRHTVTFEGMDLRFRAASPLALTHARMAMRERNPTAKAGRALKFMEHCMEPDSYARVEDRVHDHEDPFDIDELVALMALIADPPRDK